MVRAVAATAYGGTEVIELIEVASRPPGPGEVTIAVKAAPVNRWDAKQAAGAAGTDPAKLPLRLGSEAAGVVTAVGADAVGLEGSPLAVGDEVYGTGLRGAQAAELTVAAQRLLRKPAGVSFAAASGLLANGTTAVHALDAVGAAAGDVLLVHGVSGGLGWLIAQLARLRGVRVVGTASTRRHDALRALGVEPVEYGDGLAERLREAVPGGVDAAIVLVEDPDALGVSLEFVADRSRIVTVADTAGLAAGAKAIGAGPGADPGTEIRSAARLTLAELLANGSISVDVAYRYPLEDARAAYARLVTGHAGGKVVLEP